MCLWALQLDLREGESSEGGDLHLAGAYFISRRPGTSGGYEPESDDGR